MLLTNHDTIVTKQKYMQCAYCGVMRNLGRYLWSQAMWFEVHRINCGLFFVFYYDYLWILVRRRDNDAVLRRILPFSNL
jgi:hypothetical protein